MNTLERAIAMTRHHAAVCSDGLKQEMIMTADAAECAGRLVAALRAVKLRAGSTSYQMGDDVSNIAAAAIAQAEAAGIGGK